MTPARGALLWAGFLGCIGALSAFVYATFPGKPAVPVEYEDGLEKELGGPAANLVRNLPSRFHLILANSFTGTKARRQSGIIDCLSTDFCYVHMGQ